MRAKRRRPTGFPKDPWRKPLVGIVVSLAVGLISLMVILVGSLNENKVLKLQLIIREAELREALGDTQPELLTEGYERWIRFNKEHPFQLYVVDSRGQALSGVEISLGRAAQTVVTRWGISSVLWASPGDEVSLEKLGYESKAVFLGEVDMKRGVIEVELEQVTTEE